MFYQIDEHKIDDIKRHEIKKELKWQAGMTRR